MEANYMKLDARYGSSVLRLGLGVIFISSGIMKLLNPTGIAGMLNTIGFPVAIFWAWLLLLSELVFGLAVLIGYKVKYTTIPLMIILVVAILTVQLKNPGQLLKDFTLLTSLIALMMIGPGALAVSKD